MVCQTDKVTAGSYNPQPRKSAWTKFTDKVTKFFNSIITSDGREWLPSPKSKNLWYGYIKPDTPEDKFEPAGRESLNQLGKNASIVAEKYQRPKKKINKN